MTLTPVNVNGAHMVELDAFEVDYRNAVFTLSLADLAQLGQFLKDYAGLMATANRPVAEDDGA